MIEPAGTSWPSPAFTPSRWPTLSRPFFEPEPAFLWAMGLRVLLRGRLRRRLGRGLGRGLGGGFGSCVGRRVGRLCRAWPPPRARFGFGVRLGGVAGRQLGGERGVLRSLALGALFEALALGPGVGLSLLERGGRALAVEDHVGDSEQQEVLAMTLLHPAAGLRAILERDHLGGAVLADDLGADRCPGNERPANRGLVSVSHEQHAIEGDRLARARVEQLDLELRADLYAVLLPAGLDDCVHGSSDVRADRVRRPA